MLSHYNYCKVLCPDVQSKCYPEWLTKYCTIQYKVMAILYNFPMPMQSWGKGIKYPYLDEASVTAPPQQEMVHVLLQHMIHLNQCWRTSYDTALGQLRDALGQCAVKASPQLSRGPPASAVLGSLWQAHRKQSCCRKCVTGQHHM